MVIHDRPKEAGKTSAGFTLIEVVMSMAVMALVIQGVFMGYAASTQRTEWNAHALAAQSVAAQGAEQARAAKWDPQAWPQTTGPGGSDELGVTNYTRAEVLDIPANGGAMMVTNYVSITTLSDSPAIRQIRSDCVWRFINHGLFTNTVVLLRASDQ
jgi:prepilin-type N-terminal cleavage/methylation domain-containing protein